MCGFSGFIDISRKMGLDECRSVVTRMSDRLAHRGPDDSGIWVDIEAGVALGHRRLSIIDLSPEGHQPMLSACGRFVIVFNGEIYNYRDIRRELETELGAAATGWRGHSDTEVMLAAIRHWGLERAIVRFNGMFAFALWDRQERVLRLARDRLGEKPLYYGWMGDTFLFGSEIKALQAHPAWRGKIDRGALSLMMRHSYVPAPYSIYQGIHKLPPATVLTWLPETNRESKIWCYWPAREVAERGAANPFRVTEQEATRNLEELLRDAVKLRMESDVPLGAFLSGGIDSSLVVALMQAQSDRPVKTFSIGFHEGGYDETEHANKVARYLGTEHTQLYVTPEDAMAVIPRLPMLYNEPFSDSSAIPTFLVSQLAKKDVTVSLSGDGGDELFAGYNLYRRRIWKYVGWTPRPLRLALAKALINTAPVLPAWINQRNSGSRLHEIGAMLAYPSPEMMHGNLMAHWKGGTGIVLGAEEPTTLFTDPDRWAHLPDLTHRFMYLDMVGYLPDDILVKVDRASMGVSLESRVPLLDHRVVEFSWRMPLSMKVRSGQGKWPLRQILYKYLPSGWFDRPKKGFSVPIGHWLRGPLREWAETLLDEQKLKREGFFHPQPIQKIWAEHLLGKRDWGRHLWDVLMFQAWIANEPEAGR